MYRGQMLSVVLGSDGRTAAVKEASPVIDGQVEDDVLRRREFEYLTCDSLEVVEK